MRCLRGGPCNQGEQSDRSRQHRSGAGGTLSKYKTSSENVLNISAIPAHYITVVITHLMDLEMVRGEKRIEGKEQTMSGSSCVHRRTHMKM